MNSFVSYKSMLGITDIDSDVIKVDTLAADTVITNHLQLPNGAVEDWVLKTDKDGNASWKAIALAGDVIGGEKNTINTTKWIEHWNTETVYKRNNLVTHNHSIYRALRDNSGSSPEVNSIPTGYSMYNEQYPAPSPTIQYAELPWHKKIGVIMRPNLNGKLTKLRFYKPVESTKTTITIQAAINGWK